MKITKDINIILLAIILITFVLLASDVNFQELFSTTTNDQSLGEQNIQQGIVTRVIDGDDVVVNDSLTIRLIGIDAPGEKECYGHEAAQALKDLVLHQTVTLEKDTSETDQYQRLLRYIWVDDILINQKLVEDGYAVARSYPPDIKYQHTLELAQAKAIDSDQGLWASCPQ